MTMESPPNRVFEEEIHQGIGPVDSEDGQSPSRPGGKWRYEEQDGAGVRQWPTSHYVVRFA